MKLLIKSILKPIISRLGTAGGTYLITLGMPADTTSQVIGAASVLAMFTIDVAFSSYFNRSN